MGIYLGPHLADRAGFPDTPSPVDVNVQFVLVSRLYHCCMDDVRDVCDSEYMELAHSELDPGCPVSGPLDDMRG